MSIKSSVLSLLRDIKWTLRALILKVKYQRVISRLRKEYGHRKIVVAFCVSEIAKWKSQKMYEKFQNSDKFHPIIFTYPSFIEIEGGMSAVEASIREKNSFFTDKKMNVINVWDTEYNQCVIPNESRPDIIFYQQPWDTPPFPLPWETSDYALSFYIPYFLVNNFEQKLELCLPLHYLLYAHIVQSPEIAAFYDTKIKLRHYAGSRLGLGHTIVDSLTTRIETPAKNQCVIYAPHFSFPVPNGSRPLYYSSFLENGKMILQFAKNHLEIQWVFKPHPRLYSELKSVGGWTDEEVDRYYEDWNKIGTVCTTSDYVEHFQNSFSMITDCGSFMTEYSCMDKPLIRLYYHKENLPPNPMLEKLYSTFYYAHNNDELAELLDSVICRREDPHQQARHDEVVKLGLNKSNTSERIIEYLDKLLG